MLEQLRLKRNTQDNNNEDTIVGNDVPALEIDNHKSDNDNITLMTISKYKTL